MRYFSVFLAILFVALGVTFIEDLFGLGLLAQLLISIPMGILNGILVGSLVVKWQK